MYTVAEIVEIGKAQESILEVGKVGSAGDDFNPLTEMWPDDFDE